MKDCVFCKIVKGEIPSEKEMETDNLIVFKDIHPKAKIHLLIIPKDHIEDIRKDNGVIWASVGKIAIRLADRLGATGFRLVSNTGTAAEVKHMHIHFLGEVELDREL